MPCLRAAGRRTPVLPLPPANGAGGITAATILRHPTSPREGNKGQSPAVAENNGQTAPATRGWESQPRPAAASRGAGETLAAAIRRRRMGGLLARPRTAAVPLAKPPPAHTLPSRSTTPSGSEQGRRGGRRVTKWAWCWQPATRSAAGRGICSELRAAPTPRQRPLDARPRCKWQAAPSQPPLDTVG